MGLEINEKIFDTYEDAAKQLKLWLEFYSPTYGWVIVTASVSETSDKKFCAKIEAQKWHKTDESFKRFICFYLFTIIFLLKDLLLFKL